MSDRRLKRPRPRPGALFFTRGRAAGLALALAGALAPAGALAQETDTVRLGEPDTLLPPVVRPAPADSFVLTDSILEPDDTLTLEPELGDTLAAGAAAQPPARVEPLALPRPLEQGFAEGVWLWDRAALLRSTALSVGDLLERVASLTRARVGYYGQPELVAGPGALSGDIEVLLDGFPLDPLTGTTWDLSRIAITDLEGMRVERRGGRLRVELYMFELAPLREDTASTQPAGYTRVQVATGDLDTDGLAGAFAAPRFLFGPIAIAASRLDSDGVLRQQAGRSSSAFLRWGLLRERWGVHAEYRRGSIERQAGSAHPGEAARHDVIVRARVNPLAALTAELYGGRSSVDDLFIDDSVATELSVTQWGVRTAYAGGPVGAHAALRFRNGDGGPDLAADVTGDVRPLAWLAVTGEARHEDWEGSAFRAFGASARVGPWLGARLFAEWSDGEHGLHWLTSDDGSARGVERSLVRAGVDWELDGWRLGAAVFRTEGDSVAPPAIPGIGPSGSRTLPLYAGFELDGVEGSVRVPLGIDGLGLEGGYTRLTAGDGGSFSIFQPVEQARAAIVYHDLPLATDQLEIMLRVEGEYRGSMQAPSTTAPETATIDSSQRVNLDLSIRVLDVHAFVSWQNVLHRQGLSDLPGLTLPGQTAYFGVKWELWN